MTQSQSVLRIELPPKLHPVFVGEADFRGAHGGRGSAKTRSFAKMVCIRAAMWAEEGREGSILCGRQYMNSLDESSMAELKGAIRDEPWLTERFDVGETYIRTKDRRISFVFKGLDKNLDSIKGIARILLCWVDEAETVTEIAWQKLIPTIREEGAEIWVTWNPENEDSPTDKRFRKEATSRMKIVEMNYRDNPWFPPKLERDRLDDLEKRPASYDWIWEGAYVVAHEGAYYAKDLEKAKRDKRIGKVAADPLMTIKSYHDIGGDGKTSDAYSIWVVQFVDKEIRILDHYSSQGQSLGYHVSWMRERGWENAEVVLPHDGVISDGITGKKYEDHWRDAGFRVRVIPNMGRGAAKQRVEAAWRWFNRMWFNEASTRVGRKCLGWYHEKVHPRTLARMGPNHDWSCFVGETEVLTRYGTCQIMNLPPSGEVLTPCGWKAYRNPRVTRKNARLVEVTFADGLTVSCTADHLFLTASGWKSAQHLQMGMPIQSSLTPSPNTSMAVSTECGRVSGISREAVEGFIATFGHLFSALSPLAVTFTTRMRTSFTTGSRIWSVFPPPSTLQSHGRTHADLATPLDGLLPIGTSQKKVAFGTAEMRSAQKTGRSGSEGLASAITATARLMLSFARTAMPNATARAPARRRPTASAEKQTNTLPRIARVRKLKSRADVWCMTVPEAECFSLSNGAVVHNCHDADSFGLMAVDYKEPIGLSSLKIKMPAQGNA